MEKTLRCFNFNGNDPYYKIQPIKVEEASSDPYITVFYDIIRDREIKVLQEVATIKLKAAGGVMENGTVHISNARISYTAFVPQRITEVTARIAKKLEMAIGLNIDDEKKSSEQFQVNNYGTGGLYVPHYDYFFGEGMHELIKLSDVPSGGATVFPYAGVSVFPKKGSGVFWWNLLRSGETDPLTKHAGCPVLYGTKWVMNVWVHSDNQIFRKLCDPDQDQPFDQI